jgi:cell division transport system permease protein
VYRRAQIGYLLGEAVSGFRRRKLTTSVTILIMGSALLVLALFSIVTINIGAMLERARSGIDLRVFLQDACAEEERLALQAEFSRLAGVRAVTYISKEQALADFRRELGGEQADLLDALGENPLPASFHITLVQEARTADRLRDMAADIRRWPVVEDVTYSEEWTRVLDRWNDAFLMADLIVGLVVFIAAVFVISNTVRLTVAASSRAVEVMKQVGADNAFIRTPFLLEGMIEGLLAGTLAMAVLGVAYEVLRPQLAGLIFFSPGQILGFVVFCVGLGLLGSYAALRKYLAL